MAEKCESETQRAEHNTSDENTAVIAKPAEIEALNFVENWRR